MKKPFMLWLYSAILITAIFGVIYMLSQSSYRFLSNDPQIQLAEDAAWKMSLQIKANGKANPLTVAEIELERSLAPFVILYDKDQNVIDSGATLNGKVPELPDGVLSDTKEGQKTIFTWQPQDNIRIASVVVSAGDYGWVLSGRSLRETENRIGEANKLIGVAWLSTLALSGLVYATLHKRKYL